MTTYSEVDRLDAARVYAATFAGRLDCYAAWGGKHWITACAPGCEKCRWMAAHRGDDEAAMPEALVHDRAPLTGDVVLHALDTGRPVSGYVVAADSTTHLACLDIDLANGLVLADRIAKVMTKAGAPAYIEPSRRGAHLWCVLDRPIAAVAVRRALRAFLQAADVADDPHIELRPAQDRVREPDGIGNPLRMPLMPHQSAELPRQLLAPGGRVVAAGDDIYAACLETAWAPASVIAEWAERYRPPFDPRAIDPRDRPPRSHPAEDGVSASSILEGAGVTVRRVPGAVKCPFHDDSNPSLSVAADDRRVWCKNPSCDAYNGGKGLGTYQLRKLLRERGRAAA